MRFFISTTLALGLSNVCIAAPTQRGHKKPGITDIDILQYALTLEHLEYAFYRDGIAKFNSSQQFADAGFRGSFFKNINEVLYDEKTHVDFLTGAISKLGAKPVAECTYSFPYTDVKSFVGLASVLEGVGVTAYLGAAASIVDDTYLTAAGSILTVESRHSAYLRAAQKQSPFPQPFDVPLDFNEVYTLAAPFIKSCPASNGKLPVKAFPSLMLDASSMNVMTGSQITLDLGKELKKQQYYAAWIAVTGPTFTDVQVNGKKLTTTVPVGFYGQSYVVITKDKGAATDDCIVAGPAIVEVKGSAGGN
ncbi:hypothetical protein EJ04DRAFT_598202 [Polyplosphaeria fusca]|uniref:Uncharacterized protein n=1 Tax=Polyplosphaeria fusca TaxID=682080 RepID=A0A9P4R3L3_9PLEO|nr:hypothetical protein EJ04DRAFT_598202 [Polyplosphaeria fusca]